MDVTSITGCMFLSSSDDTNEEETHTAQLSTVTGVTSFSGLLSVFGPFMFWQIYCKPS